MIKQILALIERLTPSEKSELTKTLNQETYVVTEGVESTWHYHISERGPDAHTSLCRSLVMNTSIPLTNWDSTPEGYHIREHWCKKCHDEYVCLTS